MKKTTRLMAAAAAALLAVTFTSGCAQMILDAHKKIEPMAFQVLPPADDEFIMLIQDSEIKKQIVGTWHGSSVLKAFSAVDINGKPFMHINTPDTLAEETYTFNEDGSLTVSTKTKTVDPTTKEPKETNSELVGTWECKNGLLYLKTRTGSKNEEGSATAIAFWREDGTMEFRVDIDSLKKDVTQKLMENPQTRDSVKDMNFYYDKEGSFYTILTVEAAHGNMLTNAKTTLKQFPKTFKRQGK